MDPIWSRYARGSELQAYIPKNNLVLTLGFTKCYYILITARNVRILSNGKALLTLYLKLVSEYE